MKLFWKTGASLALAATVTFAISSTANAVTLGGALTGAYNVGTTSYNFLDSDRDETFTANPTDKRELTAQIWYPTTAAGVPAPYWEDSLVRGFAESRGVPPSDSAAIAPAFQLIQSRATSGAAIANDQAKYPVLFYSHGFGGLHKDNTFLAEELASQGYIVVGINHTYDAGATTFEDGRTVVQDRNFKDALEAAAISQDFATINRLSTAAVNIRAADVSFVLDELEKLNVSDDKNLLTGYLDLAKVGIFGHSLGGATAASAMLLDSRFQVGLNMDGNMWGEVVNQGLNRPFMLMNNGLQWITPDRKSFYNQLQNDSYNLTIAGTKHQNFTDSPLLKSAFSEFVPELANFFSSEVGDIDSQRNAEIISAYNLAFFDKYLKGKDSPLLNGISGNYPEVSFESRRATSVPEPSVLIGLMTIASAGIWLKRQGLQPHIKTAGKTSLSN